MASPFQPVTHEEAKIRSIVCVNKHLNEIGVILKKLEGHLSEASPLVMKSEVQKDLVSIDALIVGIKKKIS